jgi:hypothetical protein
VKRHRPDPDQALFRFAWHDEADDRPDGPDDDLADDDRPPVPPPLRDRVLRLYAPAVMRELWGTPVVVIRGRDRPCRRPPAQIRTRGITSYGSYSGGPLRLVVRPAVPGSVSGARRTVRRFPWSIPFPPRTPPLPTGPALFVRFVGTTRSSDSSETCMSAYGLGPSPTVPRPEGRGSLRGLPVLAHGVSKHAQGL